MISSVSWVDQNDKKKALPIIGVLLILATNRSPRYHAQAHTLLGHRSTLEQTLVSTMHNDGLSLI